MPERKDVFGNSTRGAAKSLSRSDRARAITRGNRAARTAVRLAQGDALDDLARLRGRPHAPLRQSIGKEGDHTSGFVYALRPCHPSSAVEQRFRKAQVVGSNPMGGFAARRQPAEALQATSWVRNLGRETSPAKAACCRMGRSAWARAHGEERVGFAPPDRTKHAKETAPRQARGRDSTLESTKGSSRSCARSITSRSRRARARFGAEAPKEAAAAAPAHH